MRIGIRTDASQQIGSGHVMRCLTLALELRRRGAEVAFVCRDVPGHFGDIIAANGFACRLLESGRGSERLDPEADAARTVEALEDRRPLDWLIVDHYDLDSHWHRSMRTLAERLMVIDDLANRPLDCDLLLDQTDYADAARRYEGLVPAGTRLCLGAKWVLLREEFREARRAVRRQPGSVKRLFVTFGANDPVGMTARALALLTQDKYRDLHIDLVCGRANPQRDALMAKAAEHSHIHARVHADDVAASMVAADLCLGAGGTTTWERCALGLPSLVVGLAANQSELGAFLGRSGLARWLGSAWELTDGALEAALDAAIADGAWREAVSRESMQVVDGDGAKRLVSVMMAHDEVPSQ